MLLLLLVLELFYQNWEIFNHHIRFLVLRHKIFSHFVVYHLVLLLGLIDLLKLHTKKFLNLRCYLAGNSVLTSREVDLFY